MKFLHLIFSNLRRKKLRTILTVLSILVAFILFGYLSAVARAMDAGVSLAKANRLVVRHRVTLTQMLPLSYKQRMAAIPGVARVMHATWFGGIYQNPRNFFAQIPVEPEDWIDMYPEFHLSEEAKKAWLSRRTGAIAGRALAQKFGWKVGDKIPIQATIWEKEGGQRTWEFDLAGIFEAKEKGGDEMSFYFRYDYFDESRAFAKGTIGWCVVKITNPAEAAEVAKKIDDEFANSPTETKAESEGAFVSGFAKQIGDIGKIVVAILSAVFFTILLVAGNTMAQSVRERAEEIGLLKAIGFTGRQILSLILAESCLISCLGGFLGIGISWLLISAGDPTKGALPVFFFPVEKVLLAAGLAIGLGVITGIAPAWQAMRLQISEALRRF